MRKTSAMLRALNEHFRRALRTAFVEEFDGVEIEMHFDFLGDMALRSSRVDGRNLTKPQLRWLKVWEAGFVGALGLVREIERMDMAGEPWWGWDYTEPWEDE